MDASALSPAVFLVFGDLHGRILPAFRFASWWSARTGCSIAGLLQVGDMGFYTDIANFDRATIKHAKDDPLELGSLDVVARTPTADRVFEDDPFCTFDMWFTAGNHEEFDTLERLAQAAGKDRTDFVVDAYCRVRGIKDGAVHAFPCGLTTAAVWGVDKGGPNARQNLPPRGYIAEKATDRLALETFDVLLSHDAPRDAKRIGYGSEDLLALIGLARPRFAFFGHYSGDGSRIERDFGRTEVYHLAGFELRTRDGHPESGSVGVLHWNGDDSTFALLEDDDLKPFTRHNWKWV